MPFGTRTIAKPLPSIMWKYIIGFSVLIISGCSYPNSTNSIDESDLENSTWLHQPFQEFPNCIDTLVFKISGTGIYYSCEHEYSDQLVYKVTSDTIKIEIQDYLSEMDTSKFETVTKYMLVNKNGDLKIISIKHWPNFEEVDKKYLRNKIYKKM